MPDPPWKHDGWMRQFLRAHAERQTVMLGNLADRLERDLEKNPNGLPGKEWVRVARLHMDGYRMVATLQIEHAKLQLEAERVARGMPPMSDEEYARANAEIASAGLPELPDAELDAEVERRRRARPLAIVASQDGER